MADTFSSLQAYQQAREELIALERAKSHHHVKSPLSSTALKAITLVSDLRTHEIEHYWQDPEDNALHAGMPFTASKDKIVETELFKIIKKMPKGGILHCHLDAMNNPTDLLKLALAHETLCVSASAPLTSRKAVIEFQHSPLDSAPFTSASPLSLHSEDYVAGTLVPVKNVRESWPSGGPEGFDAFVVKALTTTPDSVGWGPAQVWAHFGATFLVSRGLISYAPVFGDYVKQVFEMCAKDGVPYLECRINFLDEFMTSASCADDVPHPEWVKLFIAAAEEVKSTSTSELPFWGARIIYTTIRFIEPGEGKGKLRWYLEDCLSLKKQFPDVIAGFDLVGWEDGLQPLSYYAEDLLWFIERQKEEGVEIPYLFHAGETVGDGSKADMNLYDALLLGTKRIGHGFSLPQHPLLMDMCRERQIAVECCPISNELLRYTASAGSTHPLTVLLNSSVPVTLSCDDPQFFGNYGLSFDFFQVFSGSEQMTIVGLGKLARDSIEHSMMPEGEKAERLAEFDERFVAFLQWTVQELSAAASR